MSGKHRTDPTRDEKPNKLHSKVGRRHHANPTNIAEVRTAMYVDDVSILSTASSLTQDQKALQNAMSAVDNWSEKWKLNLNSTKNESTFFTRSNAELDCKSSFKIGEKNVTFNRNPKFLGVTFWQITVVQTTHQVNCEKSRKEDELNQGCGKYQLARKTIKMVWTAHVHLTTLLVDGSPGSATAS